MNYTMMHGSTNINYLDFLAETSFVVEWPTVLLCARGGGNFLFSVTHTKGCCSHRHVVVFCYTPQGKYRNSILK